MIENKISTLLELVIVQQSNTTQNIQQLQLELRLIINKIKKIQNILKDWKDLDTPSKIKLQSMLNDIERVVNSNN